MRISQLILIVLFIVSCVETPFTELNKDDVIINKNSILVLAEGLWGMNNAELTSIDIETGTINAQLFERSNESKLGDVANSMLIKGDTAYIIVTSSHYLVAIDLRTSKLIDVLEFPENAGIRDIAIANDSTAYITDFYLHSVHEINLNSMTVSKSIEVGPAPEGIAYNDGRLYVANSGFGDYLAKEKNAGTISVIDIKTDRVDYYYCGPNVVDIVIDKKNSKLFAAYLHLPSKEDSLGGVVEYELNSMIKSREIRLDKENLNICFESGKLFYLTGTEFGEIITTQSVLTKKSLLYNLNNGFWYSINVSSKHHLIAIGNAKNYQTKGIVELYHFDNSNYKIGEYQTGINPGTILFY